jgi:hypothetical protein
MVYEGSMNEDLHRLGCSVYASTRQLAMDSARLVDIFFRTIEPKLDMHLYM